MYGECFLRHENAQLSGDRDEILRKEMHEEILMSRISSNMDKLLGHMQRDNKFRKANKKAMYPHPKNKLQSISNWFSGRDMQHEK